jgi:hypothetical protein
LWHNITVTHPARTKTSRRWKKKRWRKAAVVNEKEEEEEEGVVEEEKVKKGDGGEWKGGRGSGVVKEEGNAYRKPNNMNTHTTHGTQT